MHCELSKAELKMIKIKGQGTQYPSRDMQKRKLEYMKKLYRQKCCFNVWQLLKIDRKVQMSPI